MLLNAFRCDRCGKLFESDALHVELKRVAAGKDYEVVRQLDPKDYCQRCASVLLAIVDNFERPEPEEETEQRTEEESEADEDSDEEADRQRSDPYKAKAGRPPTIDVLKAIALRTAGWSLKEIGEEFNCNPKSVYNAMARYRSEHPEVGDLQVRKKKKIVKEDFY